MPGRRLDVLTVSGAEKSELTAMASRPKTAQAMAQRARIVLACADGLENKAVARLLEVHAMTVGKWRRLATSVARMGQVTLSNNGSRFPGMNREREA